MNFHWKNEWTTPAKVGVASLCIGGGLGYLIAKYKFDQELDKAIDALHRLENRIVESEEAAELAPIRRVMDAFAAPNSDGIAVHDEPVNIEVYGHHPQRIIDSRQGTPPPLPRRVPAAPMDSGLVTYEEPGVVTPEGIAGQPEPETQNVFVDDTWNQEEEEAERSPNSPYVISLDEFVAKEKGFHQETLEWYEEDQVLADSKMTPIHGPEKIVGRLEFGRGSKDPDVVYIRNEERRGEYEIVRIHASFARTLYGDQAEQEAVDDELKHSSQIRRFRDRD